MAAGVTVTKLWDSPYAIAYLAVTSGGGGGRAAANVDAAGAAGPASPDLINDCSVGTNIRKLIARDTDRWTRCAAGAGAGLASQGWVDQATARAQFGLATNTGVPLGKVKILPRTGTGCDPSWTADLNVVGGAPLDNLRLTINGNDEAVNIAGAVVIIRRVHSVGR
jgi:hypothetical protein